MRPNENKLSHEIINTTIPVTSFFTSAYRLAGFQNRVGNLNFSLYVAGKAVTPFRSHAVTVLSVKGSVTLTHISLNGLLLTFFARAHNCIPVIKMNKRNPKLDVNKMNLSLNGCGYVGIYHVGVCACIKQYYPQVLRNKISGGSVGALVACAFMCDTPLARCVKYIFDVSMKVRDGILGPMSPDLNIMDLLHERMGMMLRREPHLYCDGKLFVSVTRFEDGQNILLNRFNSREELLQALMCSCFIPVYCGYKPPEYHGVAYVDAAMSNNSPCLDRHTITVAPFSGKSDICPKNDGLLTPTSFSLSNTSIECNTKNAYMLYRVLFPGSPEMQKEFCQQGYNDALRFLRDNDLVPCPGCVADKNRDHSNCPDVEETLPKEITDEFENSFQEYRNRLAYRLLQYRSLKVLYYMNIPSIVTAKVTYMALSTILQKMQSKAGFSVEDMWTTILQIVKDKLYRSKNRSKKRTAKELESNASDSDSASNSGSECELIVCDHDAIEESNEAFVTTVKIEVPANNSAPLVQAAN